MSNGSFPLTARSSGRHARHRPRDGAGPGMTMRKLVHFLAFGLGAGKAPVAPGTFGTLVGIPVYLLLQPLSVLNYALAVLALFALGVWLCQVTERGLGVH